MRDDKRAAEALMPKQSNSNRLRAMSSSGFGSELRVEMAKVRASSCGIGTGSVLGRCSTAVSNCTLASPAVRKMHIDRCLSTPTLGDPARRLSSKVDVPYRGPKCLRKEPNAEFPQVTDFGRAAPPADQSRNSRVAVGAARAMDMTQEVVGRHGQ